MLYIFDTTKIIYIYYSGGGELVCFCFFFLFFFCFLFLFLVERGEKERKKKKEKEKKSNDNSKNSCMLGGLFRKYHRCKRANGRGNVSNG
jgi:hypothetical protein